MFGPVIRGHIVDLVPPRKDDLGLFFRWYRRRKRDSLVLIPSYTIEDDKDEWDEWYEATRKSRTEILWAISLKNGETVGGAGLQDFSHTDRRATLGIVIGHESQWKKGIATEVMRLRTNYAFEELNLNSVDTLICADNIGSWKAAEKAGYRFTGILRQHLYRDGQWHDVKVGSVLRQDWEARQTE